MIPAVDHHTRSLLLRRVSSWSQQSAPQSDSFLEDEQQEELARPLLSPELEYEVASVTTETDEEQSHRKKNNIKLWLVFCLLVVSGVANVIFAKLQSLPMYVCASSTGSAPLLLSRFSHVYICCC
jgi:hypothetical protein